MMIMIIIIDIEPQELTITQITHVNKLFDSKIIIKFIIEVENILQRSKRCI